MNSTEAVWLVNLKPEGDGTAVVRKWRCTAEQSVESVLNEAVAVWPGQVLDVVGPDGRSFLMCSIPPWYQPAS